MKSLDTLRNLYKDKKKSKVAQELWAISQPISNTPAEKYMVNVRKIPLEAAQKLNIKSLKGPIGIAEFDKNVPYNDYVVIPVYDLDDELTGIQIIQVDEEGNKATKEGDKNFYCKKYFGLDHSLRTGKAAQITLNESLSTVFIAEGIETAASIASIDGIGDKYTVLASLGVTQFISCLSYIKTHFPPGARVILLKDHDSHDSIADRDFAEARARFEEAGYKVIVKEPEREGDDWNDVLVNQGSRELALQFLSDDQLISPVPDPSIPVNQFRVLYKAILKTEKEAEKMEIDALLINAIDELQIRLSTIDQMTLSSQLQAIHMLIKDFELVKNIASQNMEVNLLTENISFSNFENAYHQLLRVKEKIQYELESEDSYVYRASISALKKYELHLKSLNQNQKNSLKLYDFHSRNIEAIELELLKYHAELKRNTTNPSLVAAYRKEIENLKMQKKFSLDSLNEALTTLKPIRLPDLIPGDSYSKFYREFINDINFYLQNGNTDREFFVKFIRQKYSKLYNELHEEYKQEEKEIEQLCAKEMKATSASLAEQLSNLRERIVNHKERVRIDSQPFLKEACSIYLTAMMDLEKDPRSQKKLQKWLNQLDEFKMTSGLYYRYPEKNDNAGSLTLIETDSDEEQTLNELRQMIWGDPDIKTKDNPDGESCSSSTVDLKIAELCEIDEALIDERLRQSILDYSEKLAARLYSSFEVIDPKTKQKQEFDGIALRNGQLTITERKTNDGTGSGLLQRNFCQNKIAAKELFLRKGVIPRILAHKKPENWIYIDTSKIKEPLWYSEKLTSKVRDKLVNVAKIHALRALEGFRLEFTVNRPLHYAQENYQGLFFNKGLNKECSLRFSRSQKGNEKVTQTSINGILDERSGLREEMITSMERNQ